MQRANQIARLYLDDQSVGLTCVRGWADSWGFGEFQPEGSFSVFAAPFGRWSLLMHADDRGAPLSRAAADELRETENAIDRIRAKLYLCKTDEWRTITQLNIDGPLVEWKEDGGVGRFGRT